MSGGVDSLMTAVLLMERGYNVYGLHMIATQPPGQHGGARDKTSHVKGIKRLLQTIEERLNIPVEILDLSCDFSENIISPFVTAYLSGQTPNPCIDCNADFKFGILRKAALKRGIKAFATGHYARIARSPSENRWQILRGIDRKKEQSYFLYRLTQDQLENTILPLGTRTKREVYDLLRKRDLLDVAQQESQEICFIPQNDYKSFIKRWGRVKDSPGFLVDKTGKIVGKHNGIFSYTIGQRRGIGIPSTAPYYVTGLHPETNTVEIGRKEDLFATHLSVEEVNWVSIGSPQKSFHASVQIRYRHTATPALITPINDFTVLIEFKEPQQAITPGQAAVFYSSDILLGGGKIKRIDS